MEREGAPLASEFTITGPFFQTQKADRIQIRAVLPEWSLYRSPLPGDRADIRPLDAFTYGSQQLEFFHEEALIDVLKGGLVTNRIKGACIDPESGRLKVILRSWDGGASDPGETRVIEFDPNKRIIAKTVAWYEGDVPMLRCSEGESSWRWGGRFLSCQCAGRASGDAYSTAMENIVRETGRFNTDVDGAQTRIDSEIFSSLLSRISRLEPFARWDATSSLEVERFESSGFAVAVITYTDHAQVNNCVQITCVRRKTDAFWVPVYVAPVTPKRFNRLKIYGFIDDENLDVHICVAHCGFWEDYDRVTRNVAEWHQTAMNRR
ncbi:MAG: hypothetical protein OXR72_04605 [Gemmatimonadota bacterium]|nr:hypothetical protein [Gemmatimonadota bacterium]